MRRLLSILLCLMMLLPSLALAEKTVTITFTGDVTLGSEENRRNRDFSFDTMAATMGYEYFFANVKDFFAEDDLTVINLEGVLSDSNKQENRKKTYRFRGPTDFVNILTCSSIEACNIANNHTQDFGKQGYNATLDTLKNANLGAFGNQEIFIYEKDGIKIAFFGINSTGFHSRKSFFQEEFERLKTQEGVNAIIFVYHGGTEYGGIRTATQENVARWVIDRGADLVIMHHPHVVQGFDVYNNRSICYSLGNFCFGGNKDVRALQAMVVRAKLVFADDGTYQGQQLALYPCHVSGDAKKNNYQPLFVKGEEAQVAMDKAQHDTDFELSPYDETLGCALQPYLSAVPDNYEVVD